MIPFNFHTNKIGLEIIQRSSKSTHAMTCGGRDRDNQVETCRPALLVVISPTLHVMQQKASNLMMRILGE